MASEELQPIMGAEPLAGFRGRAPSQGIGVKWNHHQGPGQSPRSGDQRAKRSPQRSLGQRPWSGVRERSPLKLKALKHLHTNKAQNLLSV